MDDETQTIQAFLDEINRDVPPGVDWKEGARRYLGKKIAGEPGSERYHLNKPFVGGPDYSSFFQDLYLFLNTLQMLDLPRNSRVLDVGTGPGWIAHYLGKLGHRVVGFDISDELLAIARKRLAADRYPPYEGKSFDVEFLNHDIEAAPLPGDEKFDLALCASTLHHFFDPVAALRNLCASLAPDGVVVILEGIAPKRDTVWHKKYLEIMETYHTLERPFSQDQLRRLLELCGLGHQRFLASVNGFFGGTEDDVVGLRGLLAATGRYNYVVASRSEQGLARIRTGGTGLTDAVSADEYATVDETPLLRFLKGLYKRIPRRLMYRTVTQGNVKFLVAVYREILGREPDRKGFEYFLERLNNGSLTRKAVADHLRNSEEHRKRSS